MIDPLSKSYGYLVKCNAYSLQNIILILKDYIYNFSQQCDYLLDFRFILSIVENNKKLKIIDYLENILFFERNLRLLTYKLN